MQRVIGGRYELSEELGRGAFGRVWRGRDLALRADVAVKEVWLTAASESENAERLARAERESRNAAQLRGHPNIVAVHDVVVDDGKPWIVMDYVAGRTLAEHVAGAGPLPVEQTAEVARGLLAALGAAHDKGIVHRDVKPSNVMLADDGRVLLTDFGIAQHGSDTTITAGNTLVGTLEYMPPERFNGMDAGPAGDLYSLGVTLFQAVEGFSPFHRETPTETLTAVVLGATPVPTRAGRLTPLIGALLAKDPGARPTVRQGLAMLGWTGAGTPDPPTETAFPVFPAMPATSAGRPQQGRRRVALIAGGTAVVVAAAAVVAAVALSSGKDGDGSAGVVNPTITNRAVTPTQGLTSSSAGVATGSPATSGPDASGTLTIWLQKDAQEMWPQAVDYADSEFRNAYPHVEVKIAYLPWDGHLQKFSAAAASGNPPDVLEFGTDETQQVIAAGSLRDLTADKATFENSATWRDALVQSCTAGGKLYCVPYYAVEHAGTVGGSDLAVPTAAAHPAWSEAWIKAFTSTAAEQQIAKVPPSTDGAYKVRANSTAVP